MKIKEKVIQQVLDGFQRLKGRASFYCFTKDIIPDIVFNIILKFHSKNKDDAIFIVVDKYETRSASPLLEMAISNGYPVFASEVFCSTRIFPFAS